MHAAEDLLGAVSRGAVRASADTIDGASDRLDLVSRWVSEFDGGGTLTARADEDSRVMVERLRSLLPQQNEELPHLNKVPAGRKSGAVAGVDVRSHCRQSRSINRAIDVALVGSIRDLRLSQSPVVSLMATIPCN